MMRGRSSHRGHAQPTSRQRGIVTREEPARVGVDEAVAGEPDLAALVGVPVALLVDGLNVDGRRLTRPPA
jgi:hypothetical protein